MATGEAGGVDDGTPNGAVTLGAESQAPAADEAVAVVEAAAAGGSPVRPAEAPVAPPDSTEQGDPGYVPMSEWLDDFDRR